MVGDRLLIGRLDGLNIWPAGLHTYTIYGIEQTLGWLMERLCFTHEAYPHSIPLKNDDPAEEKLLTNSAVPDQTSHYTKHNPFPLAHGAHLAEIFGTRPKARDMINQ